MGSPRSARANASLCLALLLLPPALPRPLQDPAPPVGVDAAPGASAPRPPAGSLLIEAEDFDECLPGEPGVPRPHDLPWASGRTALVRFPRVERLGWRFRSPASEGRSLDVWLRYAAAREVEVRWSLDGGDWIETRVPSTGAFEGRGAWRWARLGTVEASAAERTLSLAGAGLRPDCLWIAPTGRGEPAWPPPRVAPEVPQEVLEQLAHLAPRAEASWLREAARIALPAWIEETRVGLHTRLSVAWTDDPLFTRAEAAAASLGAPALVRHVKAMNGACFWTTSLGARAPWVADATVEGVDPVAAMARRAHGAGLAFVAYYRHQEDRPLAQEHPDWVCRDVLGRTVRTAGEPRLCFHSPFGDATLQRLLELAARGADAIYLDESHQPLEGCWCDWTREAFLRETGLPLPESVEPEDPLHRRFLAFTEDSLARELWRWRRELRARHPELALLVSTHGQPDLTRPRPTLRLASVADAVKTELASSARSSLERFLDAHPDLERPSRDALLAVGWAISRDGAFGRPAHVWVHGLDDAMRWRAAAGALVASGCVANLDHPESTLPDPERFAPAIDLARELSVPLAGARPLPDVLLHLPERGIAALEPDTVAAWREAGGPFLGAWESLLEAHLPARVLGDDQLELGLPEGARVLFLPAPDRLEERQRTAVARFVERGGTVVESSPEALRTAAAQLSLPVSLETSAAVQVHWFGGPDRTLVLGVTNAPGWIPDRRAAAPPAVRDARLRLGGEVRRVTVWPGGEALDPLPTSRGEEVELPAFQDALVVRIELEEGADR